MIYTCNRSIAGTISIDASVAEGGDQSSPLDHIHYPITLHLLQHSHVTQYIERRFAPRITTWLIAWKCLLVEQTDLQAVAMCTTVLG